MDQRFPFRRPRAAKAIAISARVEEQRKVIIARVTMALASMVVIVEAALMAQRLWAVSQP